jgi:hypothetical protein
MTCEDAPEPGRGDAARVHRAGRPEGTAPPPFKDRWHWLRVAVKPVIVPSAVGGDPAARVAYVDQE